MCGVQWVGEGDVGQCVNCVHVCVVCSGWGRGMLVSVLIVCMCVWCAVGGGGGCWSVC